MHRIRVILAIAMVAATLARPQFAAGQDVFDEATAGVAEQPGGAVQIAMEVFGVGGVARPGEWTGIRLALTDSAPMARAVAVRLHLRDDDGDVMLVERRVTLNPSRALGLWMYARMPWDLRDTTLFTVTVHELSDPEEGSGEVVRQVAAARIKPNRVVEPQADLIGVIGSRRLGLTQLEARASGTTTNFAANARLPTSHHSMEVVLGMMPQGLPDMWFGLSAYGVIVWGDPPPSQLGSDVRARAIKEWVRRGGHLVVMVPSVGSEWFSDGNPVRDLMPAVTPREVLDANLEPYRALLTSEDFATTSLPERVALTTFEFDPHAEPGDATSIIQGVHGCVVARRALGAGMVTVVGVPLDVPGLTTGELLRADAFWHRVLGYRFDTLISGAQTALAGRSVFPVMVSQYLGLQITQTSVANAGVLLALLLFIVYWLVAGPLGHWVLSRMGMVRHSWVLFAGSILVFALAAWIGSSVTRPTKVRASHLTFLDHVHGQSTQRTTTWASILLPDYGEATIRLDEPGVNEEWHQAIAVWADSQEMSAQIPFPDARDYVYDLRTSQQITVPTRGTIKQFRFDWLGGKRWSTPIAVGAGWEPRITPTGGIQGKLTHELPGPLEDVIVVFQPGQTSDADSASGDNTRVIAHALRWAIKDWAPGAELDLAEMAKAAPGKRGTELMGPWQSEVVGVFGRNFGPTEATIYNESKAEADYRRLSLYSMLDPPNYTEDKAGMNAHPPISRMEGQHLDMGRWFTQPALIIIGTVRHVSLDVDAEGAPTPTPIMIRDGSRYRPVPAEGRTVVRWVYPLVGTPARFEGAPAPAPAP